MLKKLVLLVLVCFFVLPATSFAEVDGQQAYQEFKGMVENHIASYDTDNRGGTSKYGWNGAEKALNHEGWHRYYFTVDSNYVINDVRKTNSLVSPFIGIYTFKLTMYQTMPHATKEEAEADNNFYKDGTNYCRHSFAYQDGTWVPKIREHSTENEYYYPDTHTLYDEASIEYL